MKLTPVVKRFVLHWGEMGTRWGINRSVAQLHALLFISPRPLNAEEIATTLSVARSNVSMSLRELQGWGLVRVVHVLGDRRDHFEAVKDVWETFRIVIEERKRREIDPTLEVLEDCLSAAGGDSATEAHTRKRLAELHDFFQMTVGWYEEVARMPKSALVKLFRAAGKLRRFLGVGGR